MVDKVIVIGSNSFSGACFCKHLLSNDIEVVGISRSPEPINALLPYRWGSTKGFQFHQLDINHHLGQINELLDNFKASIVYNFAAQSMVGQSWEFPEHWFMTNAVSTIKLHNLLRHKDYIQRYVHISTPEVYGTCSGFVQEQQALNPSTPYAVSRAAADMSLKTFFSTHNFPVISTRAANVYGAGQPLYRIIPKTIMSIMLGRKLPLHGGGKSQRSFIHIDDVSVATQLVGEKGCIGDVYHISTQSIVSIRELVQMLCSCLGVRLEDVCEVTEDRMGKDAAYMLDTTKIRTELGWQDKISLEKGIEQCVKWARDNFEVLATQSFDYQHKA